MIKLFNKLSLGLAGIFLASASVSAQDVTHYVELQFFPDKGEKVITKYDGEKAANFDITAYINEHVSNGDIIVNGIIRSDAEYTRIKFDSRKIENSQSATFCQTKTTEAKPFIGVASSGMDDFSGVLLERIIDGSAASRASFEAGDVISYINDTEIRSTCDLKIAVSKLEIGEQIEVTYDGSMDDLKKDVIVGSREQHKISWKTCAVATATIPVQQNVTEIEEAAAFAVFPNPSKGISTLTFENESRGILNVRVFDLQGRLILEQGKPNFDGYYNEEINISNQPAGIYLVELALNGKKYTKELVIARK